MKYLIFLKEKESNEIIANKNILSFINKSQIVKTFSLLSKNNSIDTIRISNSAISIVPSYEYFGPFRRKKKYDDDSNACNNNNNNNNNNNA